MFKAFKRKGTRIRKMSPSAVREIIVIVTLLIIAILLSIPQYREDIEDLRIWNNMQRNAETAEQIQ
jgi:hypothetical protein